MRKYIPIFILSLLFGTTVSSCYDDKGNYDYHELDMVRGGTAGTESGGRLHEIGFRTFRHLAGEDDLVVGQKTGFEDDF